MAGNITLDAGMKASIAGRVANELSGDTYATLVSVLGPSAANKIVGGVIPDSLPQAALLALLSEEPGPSAKKTITPAQYQSAVLELIAEKGYAGRLVFDEEYRTRGATVSSWPRPGRGWILLVDGASTGVKLGLGHWNGGFSTSQDATEGYNLVEAALNKLQAAGY